jgi:DNA-binding beta-propeller fold protein YncE
MSDPEHPITTALRDLADQSGPPHIRVDAAWRAGRQARRAAIITSAAVIAVIAVAAAVPAAILGPRPAEHRPTATLYVGYTSIRPIKPHQHLRMAGAIVPVSTATNRAGKPIPVSGGVGDIAITPDGKTAYVANDDFIGTQAGTVTPIRTATNTPGKPIRIPGGAGIVAITPDGKTAYVGGQDEITPISTATNTPGRPIRIYGTASAIAITPDSKAAYVLTNAAKSGIIPIQTAANTAGKPIRVCHAPPGTNPLLDFPRLIAITPDGKTLYVGCADNTLTPVSTATNTPGKPIPIRGGANTLAFTPDSKTAYVGGGGTVTPVSTATNTAGKPIRTGLPVVEVMAMTPDGKILYVTNYEGRPADRIVPIRTATNRPGPPIHVGSPAEALAITPDGKTLYAASQSFGRTQNTVTVTPISTATNRAGKPIYVVRYVGRILFTGGDDIAITP